MSTEQNPSGLTDKQERFAHEYLLDQNASAACLRAGYSAHSHAAQGAQLMANAAVRKRVRGLLEDLYGRIKLDAQKLLQARIDTAFFDPRTLISSGNTPKKLEEWDAGPAGVMLVSFDVRANGETVMKVRQPSRAAALSALERRFAQFAKLQQEDTITERELANHCLAVGQDPAEVAAGAVVRLTRRDWEVKPAPAPASASSAQPGPGAAPPSPAARPAAAAPPQAAPAPTLIERAVSAVSAVRAQVKSLAQADAAPAPVRPLPAVPPAASAHGWADAWGNIDVNHPHIPPEVKARELQKRQRKQFEEEARNHQGRELQYVYGTAGMPNPPWPRDIYPQRRQRYALSEDDPYGEGHADA